MQPLLALLAYLVWIFIGGALLAPWLYAMGQEFHAQAGWLGELASKPFHRFLSRAMIIQVLVGLWPFIKALKIRSWREIGLSHGSEQWRLCLAGFGLGFVSTALIGGLMVGWGARQFENTPSAERWAIHLVSSTGGAIAVGFFEELLFRGILLVILWRVWGWFGAWISTSVLYATVHFLQRTSVSAGIHWHSGLLLLPQFFSGLANPFTVFPGLLNLILTGMILGFLLKYTGNLWMSIGLHTGWFFWLKFFMFITRRSGRDSYSMWFWGERQLMDGLIATISLSLLSAFLGWLYRYRPLV